MLGRGFDKFSTLLKKVYRRFAPRAVILAYHRVADLEHDFYGTAVSPGHFAQHLHRLKETCTVMALKELWEALQSDRLPPRAVAITFDDGCIDFLDHAYPLIRSMQIPATVFIATDHLEQKLRFWSDELEFLFQGLRAWPGPLTLNVRGLTHRWENGTRGKEKDVFWKVYKLIKPLSDEDRNTALIDITRWAKPELPYCPDYRAMRVDEALRLANDGLVEIGAHTITHPTLSSLAEAEQVREIAGGRQRLIDLLQCPVPAFAYPYGTRDDFTDRTTEIVREAGFNLACTMLSGSLEAGASPFGLRRCMVSDCSGDVFVRHLESFFIS